MAMCRETRTCEINAKIRHYEPSLVMNRFGSYCEQGDMEKKHCTYHYLFE